MTPIQIAFLTISYATLGFAWFVLWYEVWYHLFALCITIKSKLKSFMERRMRYARK